MSAVVGLISFKYRTRPIESSIVQNDIESSTGLLLFLQQINISRMLGAERRITNNSIVALKVAYLEYELIPRRHSGYISCTKTSIRLSSSLFIFHLTLQRIPLRMKIQTCYWMNFRYQV